MRRNARVPARRIRGFTFIEIVVAIAIIAILATVVVPRVIGRVGEARVARAKSDVQALRTALDTYKLDNFNYPSTDQGLQALINKPGGQPEAANWKQTLDALPKDPWGRDYHYRIPGEYGEFDLFSYGADNNPGGEKDDADVVSWE